MFSKIIILVFLLLTSILYSADLPTYHKIAVKINNIYVLDGSAFNGNFGCSIARNYTETTKILFNGDIHIWENEYNDGLSFDVSHHEKETSSYLEFKKEYREVQIMEDVWELCEVTMENEWIQHQINFYGNEDHDVIHYTEQNYYKTQIQGDEGGSDESRPEPENIYITHHYEYDIYIMKKVDGFVIENQEIEVSENLINGILSNDLYTNFPYSISGRAYLAEFDISNVELIGDATNGVIRITAPIKFNYNSDSLECTVKLTFTPSMMEVDWLPYLFDSFYAYCIVIKSLGLDINTNINLQNVPAGIPSSVLTALKNEIINIDANDFKIPLYPKILFNETFQIQQLGANVDLTYFVIPPKILNDKMLFNIYGLYNITQPGTKF